jgi:hypothetical protein
MPPAEKLLAHAELRTDRASRYLQAMFKHFAHKVEGIVFDAQKGHAAMPYGGLRMWADGERLRVEIDAASDELLSKMKYVVDAHLVRFAFKENLEGLAWQEGALG